MDLTKYIVKARPGVLGSRHEEKRPLRQLSALPVKRYVFINPIRIPMRAPRTGAGNSPLARGPRSLLASMSSRRGPSLRTPIGMSIVRRSIVVA